MLYASILYGGEFMITPKQLLDAGLLENPFQRYADTRFFYPNLSEQRKVMEVAYGFISDQKDPAKNLGVIAGSAGAGKGMLAMKLAQSALPGISADPAQPKSAHGHTLGLYLNTNTVTEPRHFLMAVLETLGVPASRSNANRLEGIFERLETSEDQLLIVHDGPPVEQEYLTQLLSWSVEHEKKIKTLIFLQDLNNTVSNIGSLASFLGLYVPFRAPAPAEIVSCLYARMIFAGLEEPELLLPQEEAMQIATESKGNLNAALQLAHQHLEELLNRQGPGQMLKIFRNRNLGS
ncbi:MAG: hypothetical protein VB108_10960 [Anaerolineaceae bacterium]|nr:hypothetical protein [Anaerolineaceae bacterium]